MPPLGWFYAQGLIPLGPDSSDDDEGPCELPDGRLVCGPHGFVSCGKCCVDYSFMEEVLDNDGDDDDNDDGDDDDDRDYDALPEGIPPGLFPSSTKGTGRVFPTKFTPPSTSATALEIFNSRKTHILITRYTLGTDQGKFLIRTDGACLDNGQPNPKAGWAFWHGAGPDGELRVASGRLEKKGPFGDAAAQTSNRAELRAVIAALAFRHWPGEGFHTCVIATDSEYVVEGCTGWARRWITNGWKTRSGDPVSNKDLWEALLGEVEKLHDNGLAVEFWRIPRDWNMIADAAAKSAAAKEDAPEEFSQIIGMGF